MRPRTRIGRPGPALGTALTALWLSALPACDPTSPPTVDLAPTAPTPTPVSPDSTNPLPPAFETVSPQVAVTKIKNLLTGLPPTSAEIAAVTPATPVGRGDSSIDAQALRGQIDRWMATDQFRATMLGFFRNAFQQNQVNAASMLDQLPSGIPNTLLLQNIQDSFPLTAWHIVSTDQPFTQTLTTQTFMMTPALAGLYAFLDDMRVSDTFGVTDTVVAADPSFKFNVTSTPVPLADTLNPASPDYMWWTNTVPVPATATPGCAADPRLYVKNSAALWSFLHGNLVANTAQEPGGCLTNYRVSPSFAGTDFTAWRPVTIRAPKAGERLTPFYDLLAMRNADQILLKIPRYGFLTPAFFANWATNSSNQARVSINQTLIVALGKGISGTDPTLPPSEPGLDTQHATPGTSCYGCHITLDPMRQTLRQAYSFGYHEQSDTKQTAVSGSFGFYGVSKDLTGVADLMQTLAGHPRFAVAWTSKLCNWATSAPCDESDPEIIRVAQVFQKNSFNFKVLLRELLSSPLVTAAADTQTFDQRGVQLSIARRDQFCGALANRLGLTDPCGIGTTPTFTATQLKFQGYALVIPSDGYSRGSEDTTVSTDPNLFTRAATEDLCQLFADLVVDAPAPSRYSSANLAPAIDDMVRTVMALTPEDQRAAPAAKLLRRHYDTAVAKGQTPTNALKSTFTLACMAPGITALGL